MIPDLRTTMLAGAAWVGAAMGWWAGAPSLAVVAIVAVTACVLSALIHRPIAAPVVVMMVGATAVAALSGQARRVPTDVVDRTVEITAVVTGSARPVAVDPGRAPALFLPATVRSARAGSARWDLSLPARVFLDRSDLPPATRPGTTVVFHGRLADREPSAADIRVVAVSSVRVVADPSAGASVLNAIRVGLTDTTASADVDAAGLVAGIALGDESRQSPQFAEAMQDSGLSHLTAVSGGNFTVIMAALLLITRALRAPPPVQVSLTAAAVAGYVLLVGPQPSVVRAAAMAAVGLLGVLLGGVERGLPLLSACVAVLLVLSPELAWSLGFALSVVATAGLLVLAPVLLHGIEAHVPMVLALPLTVTLAAQVVTAPLLLAVGAPVSWVSVPANLVVAALIGPITILGLLAALVAPIWSPLASLLAVPALSLAQVVVFVARTAQQVALSPHGREIGRLLVVVVAAGLIWVAVVRLAGRRTATAAAVLTVLGSLLIGRLAGPPEDWRLVVCDVGQGTAVALRTGPNSAILVDAGPARADPGDCLAGAGVTRLDGVLISHYHADHIAGLAPVMAGNRGTPVWATAFAKPDAAVADLELLTGGMATPLVAGNTITWGEATATVLWPPADFRGSEDDANNGSLVLAVQWPDGFTALIPGDVEPESQTQIMQRWQGPGFDAVVIPHHGSDHQQPGFAQWAAADDGTAVASSGLGNTYGHPATETLTEYLAAGADVRRTDTEGSVFLPDGR